jgi:hypothetical protein
MKRSKLFGKSIITVVLLFAFSCATSVSKKSSSVTDGAALHKNSTKDKKRRSPVYEIVVDKVFPNSSAERGGLKIGDQILKVDDEPIFSHKQFLDALGRVPDGTRSLFTILRKDRKTRVALIPGKGRFRFGFRFKTRDPEIAKQIKFNIWPDEVDPNYKKFTILFHVASLMTKSTRSPQRKILQRIKELLLNKGYIFTENPEGADFIVETDYKYAEKDTASSRDLEEKRFPFEALRIVFRDRRTKKAFLRVSGTIDSERAKIYGAKGYVYAMLDSMIEKFPSYRQQGKSSGDFSISEKKLIEQKPTSDESRFPGASPF